MAHLLCLDPPVRLDNTNVVIDVMTNRVGDLADSPATGDKGGHSPVRCGWR